MTTKLSNPKDVIGSTTKVPLSYLPIPVVMEASLGMLEGGSKYGRHNYRAVGVRGSVYFDATVRHLFDWWEGEDYDPDSTAKLHHISKAIASLMVMRDSMIQGNFVDDRPPPIKDREWLKNLNKQVPLILEEHGDKHPKHYTIEDKI